MGKRFKPKVAPSISISSSSGGSGAIQPTVGHDWIRLLNGFTNG